MSLPVAVQAPAYELRLGDTKPPLLMTLEDGDGAYDLTDKTVRAEVRGAGVLVVTKDVVVVTAGTGDTRIDWEVGDFTEAGNYQVVWIATDLAGAERSFPSHDFFEFPVNPR